MNYQRYTNIIEKNHDKDLRRVVDTIYFMGIPSFCVHFDLNVDVNCDLVYKFFVDRIPLSILS